MSLRTWIWLLAGILVLGLAGVGWLFWVQNSLTPAPVSLEVWLLGRYGAKLSASELVATSAGIGFVVPATGWFLSWWRSGSRIKQLERQLAYAQPPEDKNVWK